VFRGEPEPRKEETTTRGKTLLEQGSLAGMNPWKGKGGMSRKKRGLEEKYGREE